MRIDRVTMGTDRDEYKNIQSASIYFENVSDIGERISGNFAITIEEHQRIEDNELSIREVAEAKIVEMFQIKPDQDAMAGVVELRKQLEQKETQIQELLQKLEEQTTLITELTLLISNMGMPEGNNEETNNEDTNPNNNETGGEGGE